MPRNLLMILPRVFLPGPRVKINDMGQDRQPVKSNPSAGISCHAKFDGNLSAVARLKLAMHDGFSAADIDEDKTIRVVRFHGKLCRLNNLKEIRILDAKKFFDERLRMSLHHQFCDSIKPRRQYSCVFGRVLLSAIPHSENLRESSLSQHG